MISNCKLLIALLFVVVVSAQSITYNSKKNIDYSTSNENKKRVDAALVTFKCLPCLEKNKFAVESQEGEEGFVLKKVNFPLEVKLKPGKYKMTYWQKRIQQIHLPFYVKEGVINEISVKK